MGLRQVVGRVVGRWYKLFACGCGVILAIQYAVLDYGSSCRGFRPFGMGMDKKHYTHESPCAGRFIHAFAGRINRTVVQSFHLFHLLIPWQ